MNRQLLSLISFIVLSFNALAQDTAPVTDSLDLNGPIFTRTEVEASFPGGHTAWREYITKNLNSEVPITNKAPKGQYTVIVRFIVARNGSINDVVAETRHGFGMEQEVIRIIKQGPKWIPAFQNNRPVNAYRRQPITFVVQEK